MRNPLKKVFGEKKSERTLLEEKIARTEQRLGYPLPTHYREFLLRNKLEVPTDNTCDVFADRDHQVALYSFSIRKYLRMAPGKPDDLVEVYNKHRDNTPLPALMPIAFDQFRNVMLISLLDGKVYFWDIASRVLESQAGNPETLRGDRLYLVAQDFFEFERNLYRTKRFN